MSETKTADPLAWLGDQMCRVDEPLSGSFTNPVSHAGVERLRVLMDNTVEHPTNDTLAKLGAFERKTVIGKHQATNWVHLRATIRELDDAGHAAAADTLIWQVWHQVNGAARHDEFYRLVCERAERAEAELRQRSA